MRTDEGEILLRTRGQAYLGRELENLLVTTRADGTRVLLKDVAKVVDGFADAFQGLKFDGRPAALIRIARVGNQDAREISEAVKRFPRRRADALSRRRRVVDLEGRVDAAVRPARCASRQRRPRVCC